MSKVVVPELKNGYKFLYTVTDPCYLIKRSEWNKCHKEAIDYYDKQFYQGDFEKALRKRLAEVAGVSEYSVEVMETVIGDWSNEFKIHAEHAVKEKLDIIEGKFAADAGMVCFVEVTPQLVEYLKTNAKQVFSAGAFIASKEPLRCYMYRGEEGYSWTQVNVLDNVGNTLLTTEKHEAQW